MDAATPPRGWVRGFLAVGLVILSPLCAEYVIGYDNSTGDFASLAGGLLIFGPLYGAPALLIRELARRHGVRWPGLLALATALGILQAGVIDQSLFSESYRQIDYWEEMIRPTWIAPLGLAGHPAMNFLVGHVIWSFCIPIALVESFSPTLAGRPWLRRPGLILTTLLYLAAAALVLRDHLETEQDHASTAQVAGSLVVAAALVSLAFTIGRRPAPPRRDSAVPGPLPLVIVGLVAAMLYEFVPATWPGVAGGLAVLTACALAIARLSRSVRWGRAHIAAIATGFLLARAISAFPIEPLGDVTPTAKYAHNIIFLLGSALLGLGAIACSRGSMNDEGMDRGVRSMPEPGPSGA